MKNFYLIDTLNLNELNEAQKDLLNKQLTVYHTHSSSVIDKANAINALAENKKLKNLRFEYNIWLYDFVNYQLKTRITQKEIRQLEKILGNCYHLFGDTSYLKGDFQKALNNYQEALKIGNKLDDNKRSFETYRSIAMLYHSKGDLSNALEFYEKAAELSRVLEDKTNLATFYNSMMVVLKDQGNFPKALDYLYKALRIYEENNDEFGLAISYHSIGLSLVSQNEFDEGLKYFLTALKLYRKIGDENNKSYLYIEIGHAYQKKCEYDIALKYYMKASKYLQVSRVVSKAYLKMGTIYECQNQIDLALDYYDKSLKLSEKIDSKEALSETLNKIGALKIKTGDIDDASKYIEKAFVLAQELKYPLLIKDAASAKLQLAINQADYKLAYEMERLKNEMKDKIQNENIRKEIIKQQLKYEHEKQLKKKDLEIEFEKKNASLIQGQLDLINAKNKQLTTKNKIIAEQLLERDIFTQKLNDGIGHHRPI